MLPRERDHVNLSSSLLLLQQTTQSNQLNNLDDGNKEDEGSEISRVFSQIAIPLKEEDTKSNPSIQPKGSVRRKKKGNTLFIIVYKKY
jgi:hypothetical protein